MNCGKKGHIASECRGAQTTKETRPCFNCGKPGHEAKACPQPKQARLMEAGDGSVHLAQKAAPRHVHAMVVTAEEDMGFQARRCRPVSQQYTLGQVAVQTAGLTQRTRRLAMENAHNSSTHTLNNTHSTHVAGDQQEVPVRTAVLVGAGGSQEVPVQTTPPNIHKANTHNTYHNPIYIERIHIWEC